MLPTLAIDAVNPMLLWGALGAAAPIIIHLLSKRKFKVVHWAAMDFLLDADRRNRRRVRLEDMIILALRCLACALIAAMVARIFTEPRGLAALAGASARFERVIVLDDSPSMTVADPDLGNRTSFEEAKRGLSAMIRQLADQRPGDAITLRVTSNPDEPLLNAVPLSAARAEEVIAVIEALAPSARPARPEQALLAVERAAEDSSGPVNRVIYLVTDLRRHDWLATAIDKSASKPAPTDANASRSSGAIDAVRRLAVASQNFVLFDVGTMGAGANLTVTDLRPLDKTIVAGVDARFEAVVRNDGDVDADDVEVTLTAGESTLPPVRINRIAAGESASAVFAVSFQQVGSAPLRAAIAADVLPTDNQRVFAAPVRKGASLLIVDGDPSSEYGFNEAFFLDRALAPPGDAPSGNDVRIVTENQFEALPLDGVQVIFICNLYRVTEDRQAALEKWVAAGGGLVLAPGNQVDARFFNDRLYKQGKGLSPIELIETKGDKDERKWVNLRLDDATHPVVRVFSGSQNPFIDNVKVFQWWQSSVAPVGGAADAGASPVAAAPRVIARWSDPDGSPALVERAFGKGRVLAMTTALDAEWSNWPVDPSYVVVALEMARYMSPSATGAGSHPVGAAIQYTIDPTREELQAKLFPPPPEVGPAAGVAGGEAEVTTLQAVTVFDKPAEGAPKPKEGADGDGGTNAAASTARQVFEFDSTDRPGLYRLELTQRDGSPRGELFAVNIEPGEGELARLDEPELRKQLGDAPVEYVRGFAAGDGNDAAGRSEIWRLILVILVGVLCVEQVLAWRFGRRR